MFKFPSTLLVGCRFTYALSCNLGAGTCLDQGEGDSASEHGEEVDREHPGLPREAGGAGGGGGGGEGELRDDVGPEVARVLGCNSKDILG